MDHTYWYKQEPGTPLYPELEWSRPETKASAGRLLIVGGDAHGFVAPATAYMAAQHAGIGTARVLLPDALQKTVGTHLEAAEFAPSTPSGSFSRSALIELLEHARWAEMVLLAGDFGRNSETAILLESFITKYDGPLTITQDALDYFVRQPGSLLQRSNSLLVASFGQLQKLATAARFTKPFTYDMDLLRLVDTLHELTSEHPSALIVRHHDAFMAAFDGKVSTTRSSPDQKIWRVRTAAKASVWWAHHPTKLFEAVTTSVTTD